MGLLRTIFYTSAVGSVVGTYYVHLNLSRKYPNIPTYELPSHSRISSKFKDTPKGTYIAYCDTFKITLDSSKIDDLEKIKKEFLKQPLLSHLNGNSHSLFDFQTQDTIKNKIDLTTIFNWHWKSDSYVKYFEKLSNYGYPWRLMNGGYHELYIERNGLNKIDVYFITLHQYNDLRDGKLIPKLVQCLHRDYARVLLEIPLGKWE